MSTTYGNPVITAIVEHLKKANGGMLDGSVKRNRQACYTMLQRMRRDFPDHDPEKTLLHLIDIGKAHSFHGPNLTSFDYLIRHGSKIINDAKANRTKSAPTSSSEYRHEVATAAARRWGTEGTGG